MSDFLNNILANIASSLLYIFAAFVLIILVRLPFVFRDRKKFFNFLGITKDKPRYIVYLSTVYVAQCGSVDVHNNRRSFSGPAIPAAELSVFKDIFELFENPTLDGLPKIVRSWLGNKVYWAFLNLFPVLSASPLDKSSLEKVSMLVVGSQYYNTAGEFYADVGDPFLKLEQQGAETFICVLRGRRKNELFKVRPDHIEDIAILERLYDKTNRTTVIIAAGRGIVGTMGAVKYLCKNWHKLHSDYGSQPFAIALRFQDIDKDADFLKKPVELSKITE